MTAELLALLVLIGLGLLYWFSLRKRYRYWGATDEEIERAMLGDADVPGATYETTLAVTHAPWSRIAADYNLLRGGLLPIGLLVLTAAPLIAAKFRHVL